MITIKRFLWSVWLVLEKIRVRLTPGEGGGGGGKLPRILDRGVSRRFVNPNPI